VFLTPRLELLAESLGFVEFLVPRDDIPSRASIEAQNPDLRLFASVYREACAVLNLRLSSSIKILVS